MWLKIGLFHTPGATMVPWCKVQVQETEKDFRSLRFESQLHISWFTESNSETNTTNNPFVATALYKLLYFLLFWYFAQWGLWCASLCSGAYNEHNPHIVPTLSTLPTLSTMNTNNPHIVPPTNTDLASWSKSTHPIYCPPKQGHIKLVIEHRYNTNTAYISSDWTHGHGTTQHSDQIKNADQTVKNFNKGEHLQRNSHFNSKCNIFNKGAPKRTMWWFWNCGEVLNGN